MIPMIMMTISDSLIHVSSSVHTTQQDYRPDLGLPTMKPNRCRARSLSSAAKYARLFSS